MAEYQYFDGEEFITFNILYTTEKEVQLAITNRGRINVTTYDLYTDMNITIENKKQKAIELMKKLDIYKPYIKGFEKDNTVCFYENFGGFWAWQEPELMEKIKTFEEKHNCLVYAVTHEYTEFGECYDFLYISDYEEEWDEMLYSQGNMYYAFAYVWNVDDDFCSEFGTIGIRSFGGGIKRVA